MLHEWPSYLAYFTSFLTIGVIVARPLGDHQRLRAADATLYDSTCSCSCSAFLPFPTGLVSEYVGEDDPERVAAVFYGLTLLALALALTAFVRYPGAPAPGQGEVTRKPLSGAAAIAEL